MIQTLFGGRSTDGRKSVEALLGQADAASRVEAALPDLLREGDEALLVALAEGLAGLTAEASACRVLETLARRGGRVRAAALVALRGSGAASPTPGGSREAASAGGATPAAAPASTASPPPPPSPSPVAGDSPVSPAAPVPGREPGQATSAAPAAPRWDAAFEAVLANPTAAALAEAALALVDLTDRRPAEATREAVQALAGRLAMASFDHEGELQSGLARLAKGLKALG